MKNVRKSDIGEGRIKKDDSVFFSPASQLSSIVFNSLSFLMGF